MCQTLGSVLHMQEPHEIGIIISTLWMRKSRYRRQTNSTKETQLKTGRARNFRSTTKLHCHIMKEYFYETPVDSMFEITSKNVNATLHRISEQRGKAENHPYGKHITCIISFNSTTVLGKYYYYSNTHLSNEKTEVWRETIIWWPQIKEQIWT